MRAMMSDCEARVDELAYHYETCLGDGALAAGIVAGMARDEARRILADVEPETERSYYSGSPYGGHMNDGTLGATAAALAESLSAFLSAPDPAAYLIIAQSMAADDADEQAHYVSLDEQRRRNRARAKADFLGPAFS